MISRDANRMLFEKELQTLRVAMAETASGRHQDGELLSLYQTLVMDYERLLTLTRRIFKISDIQGRALIRRESEIKNLLDNASQGFLTFSADLMIHREYSAACVQIFGIKIGRLYLPSLLAPENTIQADLLAGILGRLFQSRDPLERRSCLEELPEALMINGRHLNLEFKLIPPGLGLPEEVTVEPMVMLIATDVTDHRRAQEQVTYLSHHDKLTGLYNRAYVEERLAELLSNQRYPISVIMADLNGLKLTNDVFGHYLGDQLLSRVAQVFSVCCRPGDIIGRWGGDEFLIVLPETDAMTCAKISGAIKEACRREVELPIELSVALGSVTQQHPTSPALEFLSVAESRMYTDKLLNGRTIRETMIRRLEQLLQERCYEEYGHTERITALAVDFAKWLGMTNRNSDHRNLVLLARLHDVGKVAIPPEILGKPGPLTATEWEIMKNHSEIGYRMAQSLGETAVAEAILALHERWDGNGYPSGLSSEQIPWMSRLLSIADTYDVMTHPRPYRDSKSCEAALAEIEAAAGGQFDPELSKVFAHKMREQLSSRDEGNTPDSVELI